MRAVFCLAVVVVLAATGAPSAWAVPAVQGPAAPHTGGSSGPSLPISVQATAPGYAAVPPAPASFAGQAATTVATGAPLAGTTPSTHAYELLALLLAGVAATLHMARRQRQR